MYAMTKQEAAEKSDIATPAEANEIIDRRANHKNIGPIYGLYLDDTIDKTHWTFAIWELCFAVSFLIEFNHRPT